MISSRSISNSPIAALLVIKFCCLQ